MTASSKKAICAVGVADAENAAIEGCNPAIGTVYLAPLAGYTDVPFRLACRRHGCRAAFTPLIDANALVHGNRRNALILKRAPSEEWLGTQVLGSDPETLRVAVDRLGCMGFDRIDLNVGCPVRKVTQKGAGAALLSTPDLAMRCAEAVVARAGDTPVSAKIRVLNDRDPRPTVALAQRLRDAGVQALTIHGRTLERVYSGPVAAAVILAVRRALDIPVIANGGIFSRSDAEALAAATGCSDLMIARGAIGNPWIFAEVAGQRVEPPSHEEICDELHRHVIGMVDFYGETVAMRNGRKIILAYLCGRGYRRALRAQVGTIDTLAQFEKLFETVTHEGPTHGYEPGDARPPIEFIR